MSSLWIEKHRPKSLDNVLSHGPIINTIKRFIETGEMPHLLLYGNAGTGKTSTILALVKSIFGENYKNMTLELNASDNRNIKVVRDIIKEYASTKNMFVKGYKIIILDEADSMTDKAQFCLRRIIEKYTNNVRFCLICNYANKIIPALQSRCLCFHFGPVRSDLMKSRLNEIMDEEEIAIEENSMDMIIKYSGGDMRKCLNILQAASITGTIDDNLLHRMLGNASEDVIDNIMHILTKGGDICTMINELNGIIEEHNLQINYVLYEIHNRIINGDYDDTTFKNIVNTLADVEEKLSRGVQTEICIAMICSAFL